MITREESTMEHNRCVDDWLCMKQCNAWNDHHRATNHTLLHNNHAGANFKHTTIIQCDTLGDTIIPISVIKDINSAIIISTLLSSHGIIVIINNGTLGMCCSVLVLSVVQDSTDHTRLIHAHITHLGSVSHSTIFYHHKCITPSLMNWRIHH